jgi:hypothetical protein
MEDTCLSVSNAPASLHKWIFLAGSHLILVTSAKHRQCWTARHAVKFPCVRGSELIDDIHDRRDKRLSMNVSDAVNTVVVEGQEMMDTLDSEDLAGRR